MEKLCITGGATLRGTIPISGAKNAALPIMAACLLSSETIHLSNVPFLRDIVSMRQLLESLGVCVTENIEQVSGVKASGSIRSFSICAKDIKSTTASYDYVRKMRASVLVLGPLLARFGNASVSLPGGCAIGARPVDFHIEGLKAMGADIAIENGYISAKAPDGLCGTEYTFPRISVGGTENLMMAACLARGITVLRNTSKEPEVVDLAALLIKMGARIKGVGTDCMIIEGQSSLHAAKHHIIADRIEAITYIMAAAITKGYIILEGISMDLIAPTLSLLRQMGVFVEEDDYQRLHVSRAEHLQGVDVITEPFPGLATDLQAQLMSLMLYARGASTITETIFENRFMHVSELQRMGANINIVNGSVAIIRPQLPLKAAPVMATDLRASVSLVLAALGAEGTTEVHRLYHLDRGYECLDIKLQNCGAIIERKAY